MSSGAFYSELPGGPVPGILDGFLTSLLGLYDLSVETGDSTSQRLFWDGIEGLKHLLPAWDYRRKWSWYGEHAYLCPPSYHCLNRLHLQVLAQLSSEPVLAAYADRWNPANLSSLERLEIFVAFLATKNACRLRNRTWTQSGSKVRTAAKQAPVPSLAAHSEVREEQRTA